jgi:hypothetical protein
MKTSKKVLNKLDVKLAESRRIVYLTQLDQVIELALSKYSLKQTKNSERIRWGRLVVQAIHAGASIVKDHDLEDILQRIQHIEEKLS